MHTAEKQKKKKEEGKKPRRSKQRLATARAPSVATTSILRKRYSRTTPLEGNSA
jgi:hypothetical protein